MATKATNKAEPKLSAASEKALESYERAVIEANEAGDANQEHNAEKGKQPLLKRLLKLEQDLRAAKAGK